MYSNNAYNTYSQNNVGVESPNKLIQMLFEGVLRFNTLAKHAIKNENIEKKTYWINRSSAIFSELISTLDYDQGDISHYLNGLYAYQMKELSTANMENSVERLDNINSVVKGLLDAWKDIDELAQ